MKPLVRTAAAASLVVALGGCAAAQPAPVLAPAPTAAVRADNAALLLHPPTLPGDRLATSPAADVWGRRANRRRTALIVLGVAAAAIVIIVLAGGTGGSSY